MATQSDSDLSAIQNAIAMLREADAILIGAGAGMGVDSGLPDFRGASGFWRAYPPFRGRSFSEISNPRWFREDPQMAWGFFGHRLHLYRGAVPHQGFQILRNIGETKPCGYFVYTSNVDGQFQKADFDEQRIVECHGSIHFMQCAANCTDAIWSSESTHIEVDMESIRALNMLPRCEHCQSVARPNILMFGDWAWNSRRTDEQLIRYKNWLESLEDRIIAVIEIGAGLAVPTVRAECERRASEIEEDRRLQLPYDQYHIRINPREAESSFGVSITRGSLEALEQIATHYFV